MDTTALIKTFVYLCFFTKVSVVDAVRCLNCDDVIQPRHCTIIRECNHGEVCKVEEYRTEYGESLYNVGCMSAQRCSLVNTTLQATKFQTPSVLRSGDRNIIPICTACCQGDLCNSVGCGSADWPESRGPICFSCHQSLNPETCDTISVCSPDELCYFQEIHEFDDVFYKSSCLPETECNRQSLINAPIIGKRDMRLTSCSSCCHQDMCNVKCYPNTVVNVSTTMSPVHVTPIQSASLSSTSSPESGHAGYDFFLMVFKNILGDDNQQSEITVVSENDAHIGITSNYFNETVYIQNHTAKIQINSSLIPTVPGKSNKGIMITSSTPVSVTVNTHYECCSSAGYFIFPMNSLGKSYILESYDKQYYQPNGFLVGAVQDGTVVNISVSERLYFTSTGQTYDAGDTLTVILNKLDTYYVTSAGDITGIRIHSTKEIAVISGSLCGTLSYGYCSNLVQFLPPVSKWGTEFMVPPLHGYWKGLIKIIANNTNTNVTVRSINNSFNHYILTGFKKIQINASQPYAIFAHKPILVVLYASNNESIMTIIPSIGQFSSETVYIPSSTLASYNTFISVTVSDIHRSGIEMMTNSGSSLRLIGQSSLASVNGRMYSFLSAECVSPEPCIVQHTDSKAVFGVVTFGSKTLEGYAYPANLKL